MTTALTANEVLIDLFMERAIDLLRLEAGTRDKVMEFLKELEAELVIILARTDPKQERLKKLLEEVRATLRGSYRDISTLMAREIREIMDDEAAWTARSLNTATRATFVDVGLSRELLRTLVSDLLIQGAASKDWWSRQAGGVAERFADEMRRGMVLGENNSDLIARTRSLMDVTRNSAERLVRASVQAAANSAREEMYSQNDDLIASLMWHSTLDTRTSKWCMVRDGHHYSNDENHKPKDGGPPWLEGPGKLHWGCRSTSVPVLRSWRDLGIDEDEIPETTRSSMDGQVPAQQNFEAWLKKQSVERQNTLLGVTVADLWRKDKITFRDLLDQSGRPLTTEELRAKAAR